jgi:hypothetical protein
MESFIELPAGLVGPASRAVEKTILGSKVKEEFLVESYPWSVDRGYEMGFTALDISTPANNTNFGFVFGLPANATPGTAIVVSYYRFGVASNGVVGNVLYLQIGRCTNPAVSTPISQEIKFDLDLADSVAIFSLETTATQGPILNYFPFSAAAANQFAPKLYTARQWRPKNWQDMLVLRPGEFFGGALRNGATNMSGNERLYMQMKWMEVTL